MVEGLYLRVAIGGRMHGGNKLHAIRVAPM